MNVFFDQKKVECFTSGNVAQCFVENSPAATKSIYCVSTGRSPELTNGDNNAEKSL